MKEKVRTLKGLIIAFLIALLILGGTVFLVNTFMVIINPKTYGNTEEEIIKAIYKTELINKEQEAVDIIDTVDIGTTRAVGFCTSIGKTGIIEFKKDEKGKYVYTYAEIQTGEIGNFVQWFNNVYPEKAPKPEEHSNGVAIIDKSAQVVFIVIGNGKEKYDISLKANETYDFTGEIPLGKPTMLKFEMPDTTADGYTFALKVIDSQGNNILENN